jgi:hypothetical protein
MLNNKIKNVCTEGAIFHFFITQGWGRGLVSFKHKYLSSESEVRRYLYLNKRLEQFHKN